MLDKLIEKSSSLLALASAYFFCLSLLYFQITFQSVDLQWRSFLGLQDYVSMAVNLISAIFMIALISVVVTAPVCSLLLFVLRQLTRFQLLRGLSQRIDRSLLFMLGVGREEIFSLSSNYKSN